MFCDGELERFARLRSELEHLSVKISDKLQCLRTVMHPTKKRPAFVSADEPCSSPAHRLKTARVEGQVSPTGHLPVTESRQSQESPTVEVSFVWCVELIHYI